MCMFVLQGAWQMGMVLSCFVVGIRRDDCGGWVPERNEG